MNQDTSKTTILVISMGFLVIHVLIGFKWPLYVSLSIGILGLLSEKLSQKIEWIWMKLAHILSKIFPPVLLAVIFYLFLYPISILSKLFTKDPLMLSNKYSSYFKDVNKEITKDSLEKIW